MDNESKKRFYFIAAGGVGMSALAKFLAEKGYEVSGSDISDGKYVKMLRNMGISVITGHDPSRIQPGMTVVLSTAVKDDDPELLRAKELNLEIMHRSDVLAFISKDFSENENSIFFGFSGTHGKTTTSGLCSYVLNKAGLHPSYAVGGFIPGIDNNAEFDGEKYFCAELDESDGTIVKYSPDINVINNLSFDHPDFYVNGMDDIYKTFKTYVDGLKPSAKILVNIDCPGIREFLKYIPGKNTVTFGLEDGDYRAENIEQKGFSSSFDILKNNEFLTRFTISIPGKHNIYNALAVFAALKEAGLSPEKFAAEFKSFSGMGRRFQIAANFNGITVIDDYAHHPEEILATLDGLSGLSARKIAIFQPHRYSRFNSLYKDFLNVFEGVDKVIVTDIYAASEQPPENSLTPEDFVKDVNCMESVYLKGSPEQIAPRIYEMLKPGDVVVTLGAGTVTKLGKLLEEASRTVKA